VIGEWPDDPEELPAAQDYALSRFGWKEDSEVYAEAARDYATLSEEYRWLPASESYPVGFDEPWVPIMDGDPRARRLFERHYSASSTRRDYKANLLIGLGEKLVLLSPLSDPFSPGVSPSLAPMISGVKRLFLPQ
jgi:hypothetical protein